MEDFNKLLHDQQVALLDAQFSDCHQQQTAAQENACALSRRIGGHHYPYRLRSGVALRAILSQRQSIAA